MLRSYTNKRLINLKIKNSYAQTYQHQINQHFKNSIYFSDIAIFEGDIFHFRKIIPPFLHIYQMKKYFLFLNMKIFLYLYRNFVRSFNDKN
ncbi:hypothetical protein CGC58_06820 [Capnocytophaga stomatis]|uniref:Uncharacterized protein n=1 Tax=Capnocytophaga stomatis TaxID=1848904 RepID=A0A250FYD1_9FLAO|nr:hypothetical protein CGC58_06820 [Capnocytophaga stomatis]